MLPSSQAPITWSVWQVSMLVNIELASVVNKYEFSCGIPRGFNFSSSSQLPLVYGSRFTFSFWNQKSNQRLRQFMRVPAQQTIGLIVHGLLCILMLILNLASLCWYWTTALCRKVCSAGEITNLCLLRKMPILYLKMLFLSVASFFGSPFYTVVFPKCSEMPFVLYTGLSSAAPPQFVFAFTMI